MMIQTQSVHFTADQKLLDFIEQKLKKLETFFDRIVSADVTLKLENTGQIKDKIAEIKLQIPGAILVAKETDKKFEAAVDAATDAMRRQLIRRKEKMRGAVK